MWEPAPIVELLGVFWFITFIDDYSHFTCLYLLKYKFKVVDVIKRFFYMIDTQFSTSINDFRLIMLMIILVILSIYFFLIEEWFMNHLVLILYSKMS